MIVYKFGGATTRTRRGLEALVSLTREAHLREVARFRRRKPQAGAVHGVVLVISAIGHTTRHLLRCAELSEQGNLAQAEESLSRTLAQHKQLAASLKLATEEELFSEFERIASEVRALMEGIAITRELSLRTRDAVISNGERFAMALIESLLMEHGLPVRPIDARDIIITDDNFGHAAPLPSEIHDRIWHYVAPRLKRSEVVLTQGFIGATRDGLTTTMGSESSDLTATLVGGALGAEEVVIWKNVAGIYTADPELVPEAKLIKLLSFEEAEEIGRRGARILYPSVAHPLLHEDQETILRVATPSGRSSRHTTLQRHIGSAKQDRPLAVALEQHLVPLRLKRLHPTAPVTPHLRRQRERAREAMRQAMVTWSTPAEITLLIRKDQKPALIEVLDPTEFEIKELEPISAVSLIVRKASDGIGSPQLEAQVLKSLRQVHLHALAPVENSLTALVSDADGVTALRKLHHDIFTA